MDERVERADARQADPACGGRNGNSLDFCIGWPAPGATGASHHFARAVQLNFPEVESFPADWSQAHAAELDEISRLSLAPAAEKPDLSCVA